MTNDKSDNGEPITITDKRRCDPETGEVRATDTVSAPQELTPDKVEEDSDTHAVTLAELTADLQRVQADFANYRKRALRDQQVAIHRAKAAVVSELLGILDDLDRARDHGDLESGPFKVIADKLNAVLTGLGLAPFGTEGDEFDPQLHEAVQHDGEGTHSVIGTVLRRGYKFGEHVLRHAMVGVVDRAHDDKAHADDDTTDKTV